MTTRAKPDKANTPKENPLPKGERKRAAFLETLAKGLSVKTSCESAGVSRTQAYAWRANEPAFRAAWDDADEHGADVLEDALRERAIVDDTTAAIFLLKAKRPKKYRERMDVEVTNLTDSMDDVTFLARVEAVIRARLEPVFAAIQHPSLEECLKVFRFPALPKTH